MTLISQIHVKMGELVLEARVWNIIAIVQKGLAERTAKKKNILAKKIPAKILVSVSQRASTTMNANVHNPYGRAKTVIYAPASR